MKIQLFEKGDGLRNILSLAGVSIGIFIVVVAFALVDGFKRAVSAGFDHFGSDMVMVDRFPSDSDEGDWSRFAARPQPSFEDYSYVREHLAMPGVRLAFAGKAGADAVAEGKLIRDCDLLAVGGDWPMLLYSGVEKGRQFSAAESSGSDDKVIIGAKVASGLFQDSDPCGSTLRVSVVSPEGVRIQRNLRIVGVLSPEGKKVISLYKSDYAVIIPYGSARRLVAEDGMETMIAAKGGAAGMTAAKGAVVNAVAGGDAAKGGAGREARSGGAGVDCELLKERLRLLLRSARRLSPGQEDNFSLNTMESMAGQVMSLVGKINLAGMAVALFALLVGGFGIMNILFVSVKERTPQIGLKKALGARRRVIVGEFLAEALVLSAAGAAVGLALAALLVSLIPSGAVEVHMTVKYAVWAFALALGLGTASGLAPALAASRLNPVETLRGR